MDQSIRLCFTQPQERKMQRKVLLALATAGMMAAPLAAQAASLDDGKILLAQAAGGAGGGAGGAAGGAAGGSGDGAAGGADSDSSIRSEGSNPPGAISPGAPSDAASSADVQTGAIDRTNPSPGEDRAASGSSAPSRAPSTDEGSPPAGTYSR
jgi:hypothetical protein